MERQTPQPRPRRAESRSERLRARRARTRARRRRSFAVLGSVLIVGFALVGGTFMLSGAIAQQRQQTVLKGEALKAAANAPKPQATRAPKQLATRESSAVPASGSTPKKPALKPAKTSGTPQAVKDAALSYPDPGSVYPKTISQLRPKHRYIAITLDDGIPFDERLLKLFEDNHIRCTTFVLGEFAANNPKLMKRLVADGFEIANHTYDHASLRSLGDDEMISEWSRTQEAISTYTGNQAPYMRPPYGASSVHIRELAAEQGYKVVLWNRSFGDTGKHARPSLCYKLAIDGIQPGDIVLCHWGRPATYQAMVWFLRDLKAQGLTPVTLSELIADSKDTADESSTSELSGSSD